MESIISTEHSDKLDEIDKHIIEALRKDGREAFAQIAERLKVYEFQRKHFSCCENLAVKMLI